MPLPVGRGNERSWALLGHCEKVLLVGIVAFLVVIREL